MKTLLRTLLAAVLLGGGWGLNYLFVKGVETCAALPTLLSTQLVCP